MQHDPFRTHIDGRVEIKDEVTDLYPKARVYMQGWIRDQRRDEFGYPQVYVEWDKHHWAYNGERDVWTWESHFNLVKEPVVANDDKFKAFMDGLKDLMANVSEDSETFEDPNDPVRKPSQEPKVNYSDLGEDYGKITEYAVEAMKESKAFVLFVVDDVNYAGKKLSLPRVINGYEDGAEYLMVMLQAAMADNASQAHANLAYDTISRLRKADGSDDGPTIS